MSTDDVSARDELIRRAAERGHRAEAEAYFAERDERTCVKAFGGRNPSPLEMREIEYCRAEIWPTWAAGWVECGSVISGGRCEKYGHEPVAPLPTEAPRTLRFPSKTADGLTFWWGSYNLGSYNEVAAPPPAYGAVSVTDEELNRLAAEWGAEGWTP